MRGKYWFTVLFLLTIFIKIHAQEIRVNNSFVILINDRLARSIEHLKLISIDENGNKDSIDGGYYPGVLYVSNEQKK
ncbi:MAG: hypothetical protein ACTHJ8_04835, partial [Mucilaginibacter sp.]